jgi:hypothetical protein
MIIAAGALEDEQWFLHCVCGSSFCVEDFLQNGAVLKRGREAFSDLSREKDGELNVL